MFDLFRSREKSVRYILGGVLTIVAVSMVVTLVPNYGGLGASGDPTVIAEVGDEVITVNDVRKEFNRTRKNLPQGMESIYIPMLVQQMIGVRAVAYQAERMGYRVTDEQLVDAIRSIIPQLWENGKFVGKDVYSAYLAQQNMTIPEFETLMRKDMLRNNLESLVLEGVIVSPGEVEEEYRRANEKVKLEYIALNPGVFKGKAPYTPAELQEYFGKNRSSFQVPEKRSFLLFAVEEAKIAATISVADADLQRAYNQGMDRWRTPERVKVRHILLKTTDKPAAEVAQIQKKAEDLLKQIKGGADFAELAKKNSEDTGSAPKGGDLDFVVRGQTVPEFEQAAFSLKPGEVSQAIKTMYGFHILKVEAKEEAKVKTFAEVKSELATELSKGRAREKMEALAEQIRTALVKSPAEAEKVAAAAGIKPVKSEKAGRGDPIQEVGINATFDESAWSLPKNGVTPIFPFGQDKLVVAQVTNIFPVRQAEFSEVEPQVRSALEMFKGQQLAATKAAEATAAVKRPGADLKAIAKQLGVEVQSSEMVSRTGAITGLGAASQVEEAFTKNVGDLIGPVRTDSGVFFCRVAEKVPADLTQLAAQREQMLMSIKSRRASWRKDVFAEGVVAQLQKEKKIKINEANIKRLVSAYARG
jgi:peptidyl-prolyl cis-trans isomerase D